MGKPKERTRVKTKESQKERMGLGPRLLTAKEGNPYRRWMKRKTHVSIRATRREHINGAR